MFYMMVYFWGVAPFLQKSEVVLGLFRALISCYGVVAGWVFTHCHCGVRSHDDVERASWHRL